jgi:hypothetical protein
MPQLSIQDAIRQEAGRQGVPPELALAVADQESSFNPTAINQGSGAIGTFQIMPATAQARGFDPNDPVQNIKGGIGYLKELLDQHQGDLTKTLASYGGVKTDTTYVPSVLSKLSKYRGQAQQPAGQSTSAPPAPQAQPVAFGGPPMIRAQGNTLVDKAIQGYRSIAGGFDIGTPEGRRNVAGAAGAIGAEAFFPELETPNLIRKAYSWARPALGAFTGGAAEQTGENMATGDESRTPIQSGREQAQNELLGRAFMVPVQAVGRRVAAKWAGSSIAKNLGEAIEAAKQRITNIQSPVSPAQAGRAVDVVAQGPAKAVKDQLGEDVETAAKSGPPVKTAPLKAELDNLAQQITPMASHQQAAAIPGYTPQQVQAIAARNPQAAQQLMLPPDHPLPAVLDRARTTLNDAGDTIPFEDAHKIKRLLDDAVNWQSPAKKQAQQIAKGFRQTLRDEMSGHAPYDQATEAYGKVAKLYQDTDVAKLHRDVRADPEGFVRQIGWDNPSGLKLVKQLLDLPAQGGGTNQAGEQAWDAVRGAWTHENLTAKGPKGMVNELEKMERSANGQEFLKTMYGDPQGQIVIKNLRDMGNAWTAANQRAQQFRTTNLSAAPGAMQTLADITAVALPGHPIYKARAGMRLVFGPHEREMIEWASHSPAMTKFVINNILTGPRPGMAMANFMRWWQGGGEEDQTPVQPAGGPPRPMSVQR